jgi:hypothetical protein
LEVKWANEGTLKRKYTLTVPQIQSQITEVLGHMLKERKNIVVQLKQFKHYH